MKTPEEIVAWLKSHKWYRSYVKNVSSNYSKDYEKDIRDSYLNGLESRSTISGAFIWSRCPYRNKNGISFWKTVDCEFKVWFDN